MSLPLVAWAYNILAPVWVAPEYYPHVDSDALVTANRVRIVIERIRDGGPDVVVLCELQGTSDVLGVLSDALGDVYHIFPVMHDTKLWGEWLKGDQIPTPNGNAVLVRKTRGGYDAFTVQRFPLSPDGNCVAVVTGCGMRIFGAHFETLSAEARTAQVTTLLASFPSPLPGVVDILAGDLNAPVATLPQGLMAAGFFSASDRVGSSCFGSERFGYCDVPVDHVMVRGIQDLSSVRIVPMPADPYALSEEGRYPGTTDDVKLGPRVEWNLRKYGSDHMPVGCTLSN